MVLFSLTVVRHGETQANADGIIQGHFDEPLNKIGCHQASCLGQSLAATLQQQQQQQQQHAQQPQQLFTHVYTSDLLRAIKTAELILDPLNCSNREISKDVRLRERSFGTFECRSVYDLRSAAMKRNQQVLDFTPEGGESITALYSRVRDFFKDMCESLENEMLSHTTNPASPNLSHPSPVPRSFSSRKLSRGNSNLNSWPEEADDTFIASLDKTIVGSPDKQTNTDGPITDCDNDVQGSNDIGTSLKRKHRVRADQSDSGSTLETATKFYVGSDRNSRENASTDSFISTTHSVDSGFVPETPLTIEIDDPRLLPVSAHKTSSTSSAGSLSLSSPPPYWNGSLPTSPTESTAGLRKFSMQSIASDDSYFPELDAKVLLVSHGGSIRELFRYFFDEAKCVFPGGKGGAMRRCPNTGMSTFMICCDHDGLNSITCLDLHSLTHTNS